MKRLSIIVILLATFLVTGLLAGCQTNPYGEVPKELAIKVRLFEDVVRWGALQKMYVFLKHDSEKPVTIQEGLNNVRVTGYDLIEDITQLEPMRWRQVAKIDYVLTDRQVVRELVDFQIWESEDEGKTWYRTSPVPVFK